MKEYHGPHKDHHYWVSVSEIEAKPEPKPAPTKPAKTSKPRVRNFTMIENGELIYCSMLVTEPFKIDGIMV